MHVFSRVCVRVCANRTLKGEEDAAFSVVRFPRNVGRRLGAAVL